MRAIIKCVIQREVHGKRQRFKRPTSNMTPRNDNIAKLMGENVEVMMRDRAIDGENRCEVLHGRLIVIPDGTAEDEED